MTRLIYLLLFFCICITARAQKPAKISAFTSFAGGNGSLSYTDPEKGILCLQPEGRPKDTKRVWFYAGLHGFKSFTVKKWTLRVMYQKSSYAPLELAYKDKGADAWSRTKGQEQPGYVEYELTPSTDTIYVATGYPYGLPELEALKAYMLKSGATTDTLCTTEAGRPLPYFSWGNAQAPTLFFTARQHAFESPCSWAFEGFLRFMTGPHKLAQALRQRYRLVAVPIMDLDMVATGGTGKDQLPQDFNRSWTTKSPWKAVRAAQTWAYAQETKYPLVAHIDFHSPFPIDKKSTHYYNHYPKGSEAKVLVDSIFSLYSVAQGVRKLQFTSSNYPPPTAEEQVIRLWMKPHSHPATGAAMLQKIRFSTTFEQAWDYRPDSQPYTQEALLKSGEDLAAAFAQILLGITP